MADKFDSKCEILKTILIYTLIACLIAGVMTIIYLYGCKPVGAAEPAYINVKTVEVVKKKNRSRRPAKRRSAPKQETVFLAGYPTIIQSALHQYWIPSSILIEPPKEEAKKDEKTKPNE